MAAILIDLKKVGPIGGGGVFLRVFSLWLMEPNSTLPHSLNVQIYSPSCTSPIHSVTRYLSLWL